MLSGSYVYTGREPPRVALAVLPEVSCLQMRVLKASGQLGPVPLMMV